MSLRNRLIANGYQPADLKELTADEMALLAVEDHIENVWSAAARQAALQARHGGAARGARLSGKQRQLMAQHLKGLRKKGVKGEALERAHGKLWAAHAKSNLLDHPHPSHKPTLKTIQKYS